MSLFPIPLEAFGSPDVESFASYLHRLAYEHGVYVGELTRYVSRCDVLGPSVRGFYQKPQELVRPSPSTKELLADVENSTSQHLMTSLLWFLDQPLSLSADEVDYGFRWCPDCFREMVSVGQSPYFKLIWHMSAVVHCHLHGIELQRYCPLCGADQGTYKKQYPLDRCQQCGGSLAQGPKNLVDLESRPSWRREGSDVVQLFQDLAGCEPGSLPRRGAQVSLDKIFDHYWKHDMEDELYALIPRDSLLAALYAEQTMSLTVARRFAYQLGVPLFSLISGEAAQCSGVLSASWTCEIQPSFMNVRHRQSHDHLKIRKSLLRDLRSKKIPPSIPEIAKRLGTSVGYLEYRHGPLVEKLRAVRKRGLSEDRLRVILLARSAAAQFFSEEMEGLNPLSRKQAYRQLKKQTGLPKWVLKNAIQEVYVSLEG